MGTQSPHFVMVFDKEREHMLNLVFQAAKVDSTLIPSLEHHHLGEVLVDFLKEISKKTHEAGFCDDPNCTHRNE